MFGQLEQIAIRETVRDFQLLKAEFEALKVKVAKLEKTSKPTKGETKSDE
jgi:hypothetical protein